MRCSERPHGQGQGRPSRREARPGPGMRRPRGFGRPAPGRFRWAMATVQQRLCDPSRAAEMESRANGGYGSHGRRKPAPQPAWEKSTPGNCADGRGGIKSGSQRSSRNTEGRGVRDDAPSRIVLPTGGSNHRCSPRLQPTRPRTRKATAFHTPSSYSIAGKFSAGAQRFLETHSDVLHPQEGSSWLSSRIPRGGIGPGCGENDSQHRPGAVRSAVSHLAFPRCEFSDTPLAHFQGSSQPSPFRSLFQTDASHPCSHARPHFPCPRPDIDKSRSLPSLDAVLPLSLSFASFVGPALPSWRPTPTRLAIQAHTRASVLALPTSTASAAFLRLTATPPTSSRPRSPSTRLPINTTTSINRRPTLRRRSSPRRATRTTSSRPRPRPSLTSASRMARGSLNPRSPPRCRGPVNASPRPARCSPSSPSR